VRKFTRHAVVVAAAIVAVAGGAVSWAGWTLSNHGSGTAHSGEPQRLTIRSAGSVGSLLYPGAEGDLSVNVTNPNRFPIVIDKALSNSPVEADGAHQQIGCAGLAAGVTVVDYTMLSPVWSLRPGETNEFRVAGAVRMSESSVNACQGARFTVTVVLVGHSAGS
jgi:hypothetical protein